MIIAGIILLALILTPLSRWLITRSYTAASKKLNVDPTRYRFLKNAVSLIIWLGAIATIVLLIPKFKALAITLFAGAGILVVVIGLAAQQAFSNIIGGIFIVIFRPFRVGDVIQVGSLEYGIVEDINLRHTTIRTFKNNRIIIPNSVISSENIINDSIDDPRLRKDIEVGISYDSDLDLAIRIMQEEAVKHPKCIDMRTEAEKKGGTPQVIVRVVNFGDFSVDLKALVWTSNALVSFDMHSDINRAIKKRFDSEGIEIPFPYRTVVYKNDLPKNASPKLDDQRS